MVWDVSFMSKAGAQNPFFHEGKEGIPKWDCLREYKEKVWTNWTIVSIDLDTFLLQI